MSESLSFQNIRGNINHLPYDVLGADLFAQMPMPFDNKSVVQINPDNKKQQFKTDFSFEACAAAATRFVAGLLLLPIFATIGALYHFARGAADFGIAAYGYQTEQLNADQAKQQVVQGTRHMLVSIYNLAISVLSPVVAIAYAASGTQLAGKHNEFHNGIGMFNSPSYSQQWAQKIVDMLSKNPQPGSYES